MLRYAPFHNMSTAANEGHEMADLISKKDLLHETGISYGQLYRWKRKGLIPEEWFMRQPSYTGTQTFFPRARIVARVERIKAMKDEDLSLEEIAEVVAPPLDEVALSPEDVSARRIAGQPALDLYMPQRTHDGPLVLGEVLTLFVLDSLLDEGVITAEEGRSFTGTVEPGLAEAQAAESEAMLVRKAGLSLWMVVPRSVRPRLEESARVVVAIDLAAKLEELKSLLMQTEGKTR